jgi:hypothetical protein
MTPTQFLQTLQDEVETKPSVQMSVRRLLLGFGYRRRGEHVVRTVRDRLRRRGLETDPPLTMADPPNLRSRITIKRSPKLHASPLIALGQRVRKLEDENQKLGKTVRLVPAPPGFRLGGALKVVAAQLLPKIRPTLEEACDFIVTSPQSALVHCRKAVEGMINEEYSRHASGPRPQLMKETIQALEGRIDSQLLHWLRHLWHACSPAAHSGARPPSSREAEAAIAGAIFCAERLARLRKA